MKRMKNPREKNMLELLLIFAVLLLICGQIKKKKKKKKRKNALIFHILFICSFNIGNIKLKKNFKH